MSLREINKAILHKYSQSTLSKFDIIGSYFVNLYYNEFYLKAKNLKNQGTYNNITEAYKNLLSSYVEFSKQQDFFKQIVKGIHTYCISTTRYTTMSHKECIDFMVSEFVPVNLWSSLRENQKNKLFHDSLIHCIEEFTEKIILNHLYIIIDNHDKDENIIILQDLFLTIILLEKDKIFSKFINPNKNSLDVFKTKLQQIINDKKQIHDENCNLKKKVNILEELNKKNANIILELQKNNKLLVNDLLNKKEEIKQLQTKEQILNDKLLQYIKAVEIQKLSSNKTEHKKHKKEVINKQKQDSIITKSKNTNKLTKNNIYKEDEDENKQEVENDQVVDNEDADEAKEAKYEVDNKDRVNSDDDDNKSIDEEYDNNSDNEKSVDEEFESYWNAAGSPIVRDLVFEKTDDNDYY